jgi:hypothetical protein
MTQMASRVLRIPCPLRISPLAHLSLPLRAIPHPHLWPHLRRWQQSSHQRHYHHQASLSARLLLMLNTPNRRPRPKHPTYNGRCLRRHRLLLNQTNDPTRTSAEVVPPILRRLRREGFSTNLCTNRLAQTDPVAFKGRLFVGSLVKLMSPLMFYVI